MAKTVLFAGISSTATNFGITRYGPIGCSYFDNNFSITTEAWAQVKYYEAGTFSKLCVYVSTNTANSTTVVKLRINGADGNQAVSISTGNTNSYFEDVSGTDTIAANDKVCFSYNTTASASGSIFIKSVRVLYAAPTDTVARYVLHSITTIGTTTTYYGLAGTWTGNSTADSYGEAIAGTAFTLSKAYYYAAINTRTGGSTGLFGSYIDPGDAALSSIGNIAATVNLTPDVEDEDTANSDSISVGDAVSYYMVRPGTSGLWFPAIFSMQSTTTNKKFMMVHSKSNTIYLQTSALTRYFSPAGAQSTLSTTEDDVQILVGISANVTYLGCNVSVHSLNSGSTTVTLRKNADTDTALSVSIASGAGTGNFTDTTNNVDLVATDEVDIKVVTGGTSGDIRFKTFYSTWENTTVDTIVKDLIMCNGFIPFAR